LLGYKAAIIGIFFGGNRCDFSSPRITLWPIHYRRLGWRPSGDSRLTLSRGREPCTMCTRGMALFVIVAIAAPVEAQIVTFQQGAGGYAGCHDSQIVMGGSTVMTDFSPGNPGQIRVDPGDTVAFDGGYVYGLMRFDNIFGTGAGQIPLGSRINS